MGHCLGSPVAVAPEKELASLNTEFLEERHEIQHLDPVILVEGLDELVVAFVQDRGLGGICKYRLGRNGKKDQPDAFLFQLPAECNDGRKRIPLPRLG